MMTSNVIHVIF